MTKTDRPEPTPVEDLDPELAEALVDLVDQYRAWGEQEKEAKAAKAELKPAIAALAEASGQASIQVGDGSVYQTKGRARTDYKAFTRGLLDRGVKMKIIEDAKGEATTVGEPGWTVR